MRLINSNLFIPFSLSKLTISILLILLIIHPFLMKCANARVGCKNKRVQSCLSLCYKTTCLARTHRRDLIYRMQKSKPQYWRLPEGSIYFYGLLTFLCMWPKRVKKRIRKGYTKCKSKAIKRSHADAVFRCNVDEKITFYNELHFILSISKDDYDMNTILILQLTKLFRWVIDN